MISEKNGKKKKVIFGDYQMNYLSWIWSIYRYCMNNVFILCKDFFSKVDV